MDFQSIINNLFGNPNGLAVVFSVLSFFVAVIAIVYAVRNSQDDRKNINTWEVYETWNSEDIRAGRSLARAICKDPNWKTVHELDGPTGYNAYISSLDLPGPNPNAPVSSARREERAKDQPLHDLMSFYHQVGLLVESQQIEKDFAMLLIGPGLSDRWDVLGAVPQFYVNAGQSDGSIPYGGMFSFFESYLQWKKGPLSNLNKKFAQAQVNIKRMRGS